MTFEIITDLRHEHMYDRLNNSKNYNAGNGRRHVQERLYKRKWTEKSDQDRMRKRLKTKITKREINDVDNVAHLTGQNNTYVR